MTGKELHDAMEHIGPDLVHIAEATHFSPRPWVSIAALAACIALIFGIGRIARPAAPSQVQDPPATAVSTQPLSQEKDTQTEDEIRDPVSSVDAFYAHFPQIDRLSMEAYVQLHPDVLKQGWDCLVINEAGLDDHETEIKTLHGDPVLAIDATNQILLIRIRGEDYQGVLAIANQPDRLKLAASSQIGVSGETVGTIAQANHGILAMTAGGFMDEDGHGNGGQPYGYAMCNGVSYNENQHLSDSYRRLEIDHQGWFHLAGIQEPINETVTHAVEFGPALIKDGEILVDENCGFTGMHPRAVIGQGADGQIMMLVIEGRLTDYSVGTDVIQCANILAEYGCKTALNLDGGSSAILWYNGEYVTRCSNPALTDGRLLPMAFVLTAE